MEPQPFLSFVGPDKHGVISRLDHATGARHPVMAAHMDASSKPQVKLARILPNNLHQPLGTASYSSLSGSLRIDIQGLPQVKLEQSYQGLQYAKVFKATPEVGGRGAKLSWKPAGWGEASELWDDEQKTKLARWKSLGLTSEPRLDIYVQMGDALVDVILFGALGLMIEDKKSMGLLGEMMGAL